MISILYEVGGNPDSTIIPRSRRPKGQPHMMCRISGLIFVVVLAVATPKTSHAQGFQGLGFLSGQVASQALGVSADGFVIVGGSGSANLQQSPAFRWTVATGMVGLGFLLGYNSSIATSASADGSVVVGYSFNSGTTRWKPSAGPLQPAWSVSGSFPAATRARPWA